MTDDPTDPALFGAVPPDLFRVFAGKARFVLADLLAQLAEDPFGQPGEIVTRRRALDAAAAFIERAGRAAAEAALVADADGEPDATPLPTHVAAYNRLLRTGWLVEYRDRYRRVVDFDPAARLVLHTLLDIRDGRNRSFGGAVLNVLTLLRSVQADPAGNALNVREAALAARGFMNHLRTVAGTMRRVEGLILAQPTASALVRAFVSDFIEGSVVQDYRDLHSRESPYRFRHLILALGEALIEDEAVLARVAEGWARAGLARGRRDAAAPSLRDAVIADLRDTVRVFAAIDDHVHDIENTTFRIERRAANTVRFSDRLATPGTDRLAEAVEALGSSALPAAAFVEVPAPLRLDPLPLAGAQFFVPPRPRREPAERAVEVRPPDPALLRYLDAVNRFELRTAVTPDRLRDYVLRALRGRSEAGPADFPLDGIDDFLLFERLHHVGLPPLDREFEFAETGAPVDTPWIARPGFVVRRRERAAA